LSADAEFNQAELGALELARARVMPSFVVEGTDSYPPALGHFLEFVDARSYFLFRDRFGSVADTLPELLRASTPARDAADIVLSRALRITLTPVTGSAPGSGTLEPESGTGGGAVSASGSCVQLRPTAAGAQLLVAVPPTGVVIRTAPGPGSQIGLRRFGDLFDVHLGMIGGGAAMLLAPPADGVPLSWHVQVLAGSAVSVCSVR
jgi:hypothetical protein